MNAARKKAQNAIASLDALAARLAAGSLRYVVWLVIFAFITGASVWPAIHSHRLTDLLSNKLTEAEVRQALIYTLSVAGGLLAVSAAFIFLFAWRRKTTASQTALTLQRAFAILALLPVVTMLRAPIEKEWPKLTLFLITIGAIGAAITIYATPLRLFITGSASRWKRILTAVALFGAWAAYSYWMSRLAITNHRAFNSNIADLGYYDNIFYQSIHGQFLGCSFLKGGYHYSSHFDPFLVLLSPLYLLYPRAEFLLAFQSIWLGSAAIPVYLLAQHITQSRSTGLVLAFCFLIYPALHGANLYDFHSLALITPLVVWLLYFLHRGMTARYVFTLLALLLIREDVSLLMCFVGFYALLLRVGPRARLGWITILLSLTYFVCVKALVMKSVDPLNTGDETTSFAYYYADLIPHRNGGLGLLTSLITNPVFVLVTIFDEAKVLFLIKLFLPLAFLPFIAKRGRFMLIYGLTFCLLATRGAVFSTHFQYSCILFPIAFSLVPIALERVKRSHTITAYGLHNERVARSLLAFVFVASVLLSWKYGAIVANISFKGGFARIVRSLTDEQKAHYAWVQEQLKVIPKDARVAATTNMGPHISNRREAYFYPSRKKVDYALVDENDIKKTEVEKHQKNIANGKVVEVSRRGKSVLLQVK